MVVTYAQPVDPWDPYAYGPDPDAPGRRKRQPVKLTDALGQPLNPRALPVSERSDVYTSANDAVERPLTELARRSAGSSPELLAGSGSEPTATTDRTTA
jgi:hypothetical protein